MKSSIVNPWNTRSNPTFNVGSILLKMSRNPYQSFSHVFKQSNGHIFHSYACYIPFEHLHSIIQINVYSMMNMSSSSLLYFSHNFKPMHLFFVSPPILRYLIQSFIFWIGRFQRHQQVFHDFLPYSIDRPFSPNIFRLFLSILHSIFDNYKHRSIHFSPRINPIHLLILAYSLSMLIFSSIVRSSSS